MNLIPWVLLTMFASGNSQSTIYMQGKEPCVAAMTEIHKTAAYARMFCINRATGEVIGVGG